MSNQKVLLESGTNEVEFLIFRSGNSRYAVNVSKVLEISMFNKEGVSTLPGNEHPAVIGTYLFREKPVIAIDFASVIQSTETIADEHDETKRPLMLVLEFNQTITSYKVEAIEHIQRITWENFIELSEDKIGQSAKWSTGVFKCDGELIVAIDFEAILAEIIPTQSPTSYLEQINEQGGVKDSSFKVLYCEDSMIIQKVVLKALQTIGIQNVEVCGSGVAGLEYLQSPAGKDVNLIISDIEMPKMDGLTLCKRIRSDAQLNHLPLLFFSSTISEQMRIKCESVGGTAAYAKPEVHELAEYVRSYCNEQTEKPKQ